jgi:hypothetical protein
MIAATRQAAMVVQPGQVVQHAVVAIGVHESAIQKVTTGSSQALGRDRRALVFEQGFGVGA